jgi:hypothetical protein
MNRQICFIHVWLFQWLRCWVQLQNNRNPFKKRGVYKTFLSFKSQSFIVFFKTPSVRHRLCTFWTVGHCRWNSTKICSQDICLTSQSMTMWWICSEERNQWDRLGLSWSTAVATIELGSVGFLPPVLVTLTDKSSSGIVESSSAIGQK